MAKLTAQHEDQVDAIAEDIRNALSEDFEFTSPEQVVEVVAKLKAKLDKIADQADTYIHED